MRKINNVHLKNNAYYLLFLAVLAFFLISCDESGEVNQSPSRSAGSSTVNVKGVVVDTSEIANQIISPGTFEAYEQLNITPEIAGLIRRIHFSEGDRVRKGQLLISMDDREIEGEIKKLELEIELAEDELHRAERLFEIQAISEEELQRIKNTTSTLEAEKDLLQIRQSKLNVYAPFSGQIGLRHISEGNYISPGARIATLHQLNPIKLDFDVPETYINQIGVGSQVNFAMVGEKNQNQEPHVATIYAVEPGVDPQTRTMRVRARVNNERGIFLPGRFAQVILRVDVNPKAVLVPAEAVIPVIEGQIIFVSKNGKAERIPIETGIRTGNLVEIKKGLNPGDTVITTGLMSLSEGASMNVDLVDFNYDNNNEL